MHPELLLALSVVLRDFEDAYPFPPDVREGGGAGQHGEYVWRCSTLRTAPELGWEWSWVGPLRSR